MNSQQKDESSRSLDDIKMWLGNEKKAMCVRFLFVQPGVVSTCSVTERISFVNSFAAVFRKGVLEFVWIFFFHPCVFLHFDSIFDFAQQR